MATAFDSAGGHFRCPGCGRVIEASGLKAGQRIKCARCKKLMRFGPHLFAAETRADWQLLRTILLVACIAATLWCLTIGYAFGARTGAWVGGFGGAIAVWLVAAGCIALAARTAQNNGILAGVTATMVGVSLFFMERLGERVGYDVAAWREFASYELWAPSLVLGGLAVFAASLIIQTRARAV